MSRPTPAQLRYQYLRKFFSEEFMRSHKYVLERDRRPPHETAPTKVCKTCGVRKRNDFGEFLKEPWGPKQFGKHTTTDVCRECYGRAISDGHQHRRDADALADQLMFEDAKNGMLFKEKSK